MEVAGMVLNGVTAVLDCVIIVMILRRWKKKD